MHTLMNTLEFPALRFVSTTFEVECLAPLRFSKFPVAQLRDDFGNLLRHQACRRRRPAGQPVEEAECAGCECDYGRIFNPVVESAADVLAGRPAAVRAVAVPRPFLFAPAEPWAEAYPAGARWAFGLTLAGSTMASFPLFVELVRRLGERGIGFDYRQGAGRFRVVRVTARRGGAPGDDSSRLLPVYDAAAGALASPPVLGWDDCRRRARELPCRRLRVTFQAPVELRQNRDRSLEFTHLWAALTTRLQELCHYHCGGAPAGDFAALAARARQVRKTHDGLRHQHRARFSYEKRAEVFAGGHSGPLVFEGDLAPFLPVLAAGEWLHVGRHCVLGNGGYDLS